MRLVGVELRRFWARRAVAVVLLVATALGALLLASALWSTRPASPAERAAAETQLAVDRAGAEREFADCQANPEQFLGEGATARQCRTLQPEVAEYLPRQPLSVEQERTSRALGLTLLTVAAAAVLAATFSGADWASGSMSSQLLVQPRRLRVWAAKAVAVVLSTSLVGAVLVAAFWGALYAVASSRGLLPPREVTDEVLGQGARSVALVAATALGSHALTMLLRSTVGTLGLLFAYAVAGEVVVASMPFEQMSRWSLANNVQAWVQGGFQVYDETICQGRDAAVPCDPTYVLSTAQGAAFLGALLLVVLVVSPIAFRRRDVA